MRETLARAWRIFGAGLCFALFGIGGVLLRVAVFPLLTLAYRDPARRRSVAQRIISRSFRGFVDIVQMFGVITYEVTGADRLERDGLLILANHPSLLDVVLLIAFVKRCTCIVKAPLARNPFTRGPVRSAGYICNDEGPGLVEDCVATLRDGQNLLIFPEGTRSRPGAPLRMQRGAANVAVRARRDITPVVVHCVPPFLTKLQGWWYEIPPRAVRYRIEVRDDIPVGAFVDSARSDALAARQLTDHLKHYFEAELHDAHA